MTGMDEEAATRRRWFQFSLGTMFVVVIVIAVPLALVNRAVQQRRHALDALRNRGAEIYVASDPAADALNNAFRHFRSAPWRPTVLPFWRRSCGDEAIGRIILPSNAFSGNDIDDVERIFPEAVVTH